MRIIQISDTHLSPTHGFFAANLAATARWLAADDPALIVHTGDLSMDGAGTAEELAAAAKWSGCFAPLVLSVPGNHDVGDHAAIKPTQTVDDSRLAAWRTAVGPDRWSLDRGGWRLVGLNAMLLGTGHAEEDAQFAWLEATLNTALPVALFLHKPLFIEDPAEGPHGYWTVTPEPRRRLMSLMAGANVRLVASGHLHVHRQFRHGDIDYVWGPAASFVCGDSQPDLGGARSLGAVEHVFGPDSVTSRFIRPEGLEDLTIEPVQHILYPRPAEKVQ